MARGDVEKLFTTDPLFVHRCSEKAVKVSQGDEEAFWLPFSQITDPSEEYVRKSEGEEIEFTIYEWLAREKGLV